MLFKKNKPGVVIHTCNFSTWNAGAGGSRVLGQSGLHSETLSQKNPKKQNNNKKP
jgi:hypothetical protein